jgi:hypothetical protein
MKKFDLKMGDYPKHYDLSVVSSSTLNKFRYYDQLKNMILIYYLK